LTRRTGGRCYTFVPGGKTAKGIKGLGGKYIRQLSHKNIKTPTIRRGHILEYGVKHLFGNYFVKNRLKILLEIRETVVPKLIDCALPRTFLGQVLL
jgi:hypothetical protein